MRAKSSGQPTKQSPEMLISLTTHHRLHNSNEDPIGFHGFGIARPELDMALAMADPNVPQYLSWG